ncbi:MAG: Planctomycete cytochrome [Planctomycetaceae bacterium]|nr:Planctomycete cytochrome [Planctomycetaceae bacterium]
MSQAIVLQRRLVIAVTCFAAVVCVLKSSDFPALAEDPAVNQVVDEKFFETQIRPVLAGTCFKCHGGEKVGGGLRVDSREALLKGGETGASVILNKPDESLLIHAIRHDAGVASMPPGKKLPPETVAAVTTWIRAGAPWPEKFEKFQVGKKHWAFEPVKPVSPPTEPAGASAIDRFVAAQWEKHGLIPLAAADKLTLIRRATFDLTGLPPTPEEVTTFLQDETPGALAKVIDRLLDSPAYGERWGRHWLDLVRYADTAGETADFPVAHAWRYRNYVIDAFNQDKPYDVFLKEQIAGDILAQAIPAGTAPEKYRELIIATGYLGVARRFGFDVLKDHYLTIEDTIDTVGKSVLGVTIACARCHDHKFDPFTVQDYYGLYGIFESTRFPFPGCEKVRSPRDMVPLMPPGEMQKTLAALDVELKACENRKAVADKQVLDIVSKGVQLTVAGDIPNGGQQTFDAGKNAEALRQITVHKGDMLQLSVLPKVGHGADSTLVEFIITELSGEKRVWNLTEQLLPDLYQNGEGMQHADSFGNSAVWYLFDLVPSPTLFTLFIKDAEKTPGLQVWRGLEDTPSLFANTNSNTIKFITVTQPGRSIALHPGPRGGVAAAWQSPIDGPVMVSGKVQDLDGGGGDGIAWVIEHRPGTGRELTSSRQFTVELNQLREKRTRFEQTIEKAYSVVEGEPHDAQIQKRGDPDVRGDVTPRSFPKILGGQNLPAGSTGSGRLQLAEWLASPANPLTSRVLVNRLWQHHFGRGLVNTPNDFGTRGEAPSHSELLDYLAGRFVEGGWSIKSMHRLIMLTDAYQRTSDTDLNIPAIAADVKSDPGNVYLWKFSRRRLSAEEIRDSILAVSGDLDRTPGGPHPFPDEKAWQFTQHTPFSALYDTDRRSVYLMTQRIKRHPFLTVFDGADANTSTPQRFQTIVPTQALFFMNDPFLHAKSQSLARRLLTLDAEPARLGRAYRLLFGRGPSPEETASANEFLIGYQTDLADIPAAERPLVAWAAYVRVLFSENEFLFVD